MMKSKLLLLIDDSHGHLDTVVTEMTKLMSPAGLEAMALVGVDSNTKEGCELALDCVTSAKTVEIAKLATNTEEECTKLHLHNKAIQLIKTLKENYH